MLIKHLTVECTECNKVYIAADCDMEFEEYVDMETCPNCMKLVAEKI